MSEQNDREELLGGEGDRSGERPTGPASPTDPYPQPVQEIVDPRDPDSFEDRERTRLSGHDQPRDEEAG